MIPKSIRNIRHYVNDFSWVLDTGVSDALSTKIFSLSEDLQVVTVLFPHREWLELRDIWVELFNSIWIWKKWKNNWLLLLISTDEKKIRIVVWKWLEWIYSDNWCRDIIEWKLRPLLNSWDYKSLITIWYEEVSKRNLWKWDIETHIWESKLSLASTVALSISTFFWVPISLLVLSTSLPAYAIYIHISLVVTIIVLIKFTSLKQWIQSFLFIVWLYLFLCLSITGIIFYEYKKDIFCKENPQICEQRKLEAERQFCESRPLSCINDRIDYDSIDYQKYEAEKKESSARSSSSSQSSSSSRDSSSSSSSSFDGWWGSTNGAWWWD